MSISDTLKKAVEKAVKQQSMRSVARESGVEPAVLSRWLSGDKIPRGDTLDAIANWAGFELKKK
ncbi:helix-turn-helix domain-containing protein [Mariniblastus fucicola]|uniref:HTH cro/C1-type domain-containing protein n=1 Tax=Mariniblastus fucicola TaxID=980251 RepID=A0A5B9PSG0_9BACT|nr:helix-turn-helix transcriptional regulator [Mariniblastus fucicola]QEG25163.1 hypothetical protein MFFC18_50870 [Mariniblastus fucicola]